MFCYGVTANFFSEEFIPVPILEGTPIPESKSSSFGCTCKSDEYYSRVYGPGVDSSQFTLQIICRSPNKYREVRNVEKQWHTKLKTLRMGIAAQREMFFHLKTLCDCDSDMQSSIESIAKHQERVSTDPGRTSSSSSSGNAPLRQGSSNPQKTHSKAAAAHVLPDLVDILKPDTPETETSNTPAIFRESKEASDAAALPDAERRRATNERIVRTLRQRLSLPYSPRTRGWIVVTESPTYPGYLSINYQVEGYPVIDEMKMKQCLPDRRLVVFTTVVPNVRRVLNLILAELELFMCDMQCPACAELHKDWYQIDLDTVQLVIMRWARWMSTAPYDKVDGQLKSKWFERTTYAFVDKVCSTTVIDGETYSQKTWGWWTRLAQDDHVGPSAQAEAVKLTRYFW